MAAAGAQAGEADTLQIEHLLAAEIARQNGDIAPLAREAAWYEEFGVHEAVPGWRPKPRCCGWRRVSPAGPARCFTNWPDLTSAGSHGTSTGW